MMLNYIGENVAAKKIENAVMAVLKEAKVRTKDLGGTATTSEMSGTIAAKIEGS